MDRGSKATLPHTIPCREFKSSANNSTVHSFDTAIKGIQASYVQTRVQETYITRPWEL
ncbi:hypothetical protein KSP40_PGU000233 [Platanthera guangdongensis]|uniref:Uncharacterized protein n=1 Tax=Platanthera guangdongensis TaxID=2320717 RepID=A0ABR2M135_9ASPA